MQQLTSGRPELVVLTYLWHKGWRPNTYGPEHVRRMRDMLAQHLTIPHRFVCVTSAPIEGIETVPLPEIAWQQHRPGIPTGYFKLWSFSRAAAELGKRILVIDLDTIVLQDLAPLLADAPPFTCLRGFSCPYGSAIYQLEAGRFPHLWEDLDEKTARAANQARFADGRRFYGSDQAVMAYMLPDGATWTDADGLYHEGHIGSPILPANCRALIFGSHIKPWQGPRAELYWGRG
jgi:hypothetical protein